MSSQMAHPRGCIVIVIAFIWLSTAVCFDSQIRCKFSLIWITWGLRSPLGHLTLAHVGSAIRSGPPAKENYFGVGRRTWTPDRPFRCLNFHFLHLLFVLFSRCYTTFSYSFRYPGFPVYMIFLLFQYQPTQSMLSLLSLKYILEQLQRSYCIHKLCTSECRTKTLELERVR